VVVDLVVLAAAAVRSFLMINDNNKVFELGRFYKL
jgi:hypothetical protein